MGGNNFELYLWAQIIMSCIYGGNNFESYLWAEINLSCIEGWE